MPEKATHPEAAGSRRDLLAGAGVLAATAAAASLAPETAAEPAPPAAMRPTAPRRLAARRLGGAKLQKGQGALPPLGIIALNRLAFGPRPGDLAAFEALGGDDDARLTAWVDQQLDPTSIPDPEIAARLSAAGFITLNKSRTQLWLDHHVNNTGGSSFHNLPREEVIRAAYLRAVYSERQLSEVLADFWHNHFNVYAGDYWVAHMFPYYDREVIRANMLGNFRQMLEDVARSTSMLYYLDNYTSSNSGPNENFCRELFELHTLGAENYLGVMQQNQVPIVGGFPQGYVDADVFEATRCFTGWTVSNSSSNPTVGNTGDFYYRSEWHDRFQKNVLGIFIPQDQPDLKDGRDVLDVLAAHPGTGRHIARKLCQRLISDFPPQTVIDQAAALFTAQQDAPDQLKQVVRLILLSDEFKTTWGEKVKRPFDIAAAALRAGGADVLASVADSEFNSFLSRVNEANHRIFYWPAPDGFPDERAAWQSTTPRGMGWRMCHWLTDWDDSGGDFFVDLVAQTPPGVRTATEIADFWIDRVLQRPADPADREELIAFMGQGLNPDLELPLDSDENTRDRLRSMVGLIYSMPDFLWR